MHMMSTNFAKTMVWKYSTKLWRHKQRTPNTNDHDMPLNEPPPMKNFCVRHCTNHRKLQNCVWIFAWFYWFYHWFEWNEI